MERNENGEKKSKLDRFKHWRKKDNDNEKERKDDDKEKHRHKRKSKKDDDSERVESNSNRKHKHKHKHKHSKKSKESEIVEQSPEEPEKMQAIEVETELPTKADEEQVNEQAAAAVSKSPKLNEQISEELTCSVCLDVFTDPIVLSCAHNLCRICANELVKTQAGKRYCKCPLCTQITQLGTTADPHPFTTNIVLSNMIKVLNGVSSETIEDQNHVVADEQYIVEMKRLSWFPNDFIEEKAEKYNVKIAFAYGSMKIVGKKEDVEKAAFSIIKEEKKLNTRFSNGRRAK